MKKIICTVIVFAFLANVSAQLKVNSTGQVGIGTASPQYRLDVNGDTRVTGGIYPGGSTAGLIAATGGVNVDEAGIYGLRYAEFVVPLVKAVQELSAQVNELTELVHSLQKQNASLKNGTGGE